MTLSAGLRWDHFNSSVPAQIHCALADSCLPGRSAAISDIPNWNNIFPRVGVSYDVTGRGQTALKGNVGWYVQSQGPAFASTYNPMIVSTDSRTWTDPNRNDIAEENELGPPSNSISAFVRTRPWIPVSSGLTRVVWDIGVQHQLKPGLSIDVSYNQRSFNQLQWATNLAVKMSDYTIINVADPRGNGQFLPVYSISPSKFGQVEPVGHELAQ